MKRNLLFLSIPFALFVILNSCSKGGSTPAPTTDPPTTTTPITSAPTITGFTPGSARVGASVVITGTEFGTDVNNVSVRFGTSVSVKPVSVTPTKITVVVPADASTGKLFVTIKVTTASTTDDFTVTTDPVITDPVIDYSGYNKIEFTETITLPTVRRYGLAAAAAGNKIVFAGGGGEPGGGLGSDVVNIYDITTNLWSTAKLSKPRYDLAAAAAGNKILFAGGSVNGPTSIDPSDVVDIYDVVTNTWTVAHLSEARAKLGAAGAGDEVVFVGGVGQNYSKAVDIYNVNTGVWSKTEISKVADRTVGAAAGNRMIFNSAGKAYLDVFDVGPNSITERTPPLYREWPAMAGAEKKILIVGNDTKIADIFDIDSQEFTTVTLSESKNSSYQGLSATSAGTKIVIGSALGTTVDVYDVVTNKVTTLQASGSNYNMASAATKNKMIFALNYGPDDKMRMDIYTLSK